MQKRMMKRTAFFLSSVAFMSSINAQNIGIGTTTPHPSAQLEVASTSKGFLPPRMSYAQRNAVVNPAAGLIVYCTDCGTNGQLQTFDGTNWQAFSFSAALPPASLPPTYPSVTICSQEWMTKNLSVDRYRNGDLIPQVTNAAAWSTLTTGAWCWYNNDSATYAATYGRIYNWYAVTDPRGLAPTGWHIPTDAEWTTLKNCLGGESISGGKMKSIDLWAAPNIGATNSSGFTGLPGGRRFNDGSFANVGLFSDWWTTTEFSGSLAWFQFLSYNNTSTGKSQGYKVDGYYVRCVKD